MEKKYSYGIQGVYDEKSLIDNLKKANGVLDCGIENDRLYYVLDEHADEYSVLLEANELCAKYGGLLTFGDEDGKEQEVSEEAADGENGVEDADGEALEGEAAEIAAEQPKKTLKSIFEEEEDYSTVDKIVTKRKKTKGENVMRIVEWSVSAILLIVCFFIEGEDSGFGLKSILSVLAFAIGGYEIFYAAIADLAHKKILSETVIVTLLAVLGALLGYVLPTTALVLAFSAAKTFEFIAEGITDAVVDETFYTGSVDVTLSDGQTKHVEALAVGDEMLLKEFDVVPCDSVALTETRIDAYVPLGVPETIVKEGEELAAGSVVLSKEAKAKVKATNAESKVSVEKNKFIKKLEDHSPVPYPVKIINSAMIVLCFAAAFIVPALLGGDYMLGLRIWGARAIGVMGACTLIYAWTMGGACFKNALIIAKSRRIDYADVKAMEIFADANSFVFNSSALTEDGKVKEDVYGCMNELLSCGVKSVSTEFDNELSKEEADKLRFKRTEVKNEKQVLVGRDVTLGDGKGKIDIESGEISFIPLAYKLAKKAKQRKALIIVAKVVAAVALIVATVFVGTDTINPIYFGAMSGGVSALSAFLVLLSAKKPD